MKIGVTIVPRTSLLAVPAAFLLLLPPGVARAAEGPNDRETDHLDAFDDGGPRSCGLLLDPGGIPFGAFGAEADLMLGDAAAFSVEGDFASSGAATALGAAGGFVLFPQRVPFHGFYLHPRLTLSRANTDGESATLLGGGATMGWEWTLRVGLTFRAGAGAEFSRTVAGNGAAATGLDGVQPLVDGVLGWVF